MQARAIEKLTNWPGVWIRRFIALVFALLLGPVACSTSQRGGSDSVHSAQATHAGLEWNDGKKWVVAKPMMAHLRNLEKAVEDFGETPGADHAILATEIQDNLGRLVTNCTMEGKAHDELHKWLMPFLALSADYIKASDPQVQQKKFREIKDALLVFNQYFE